MEMELKFNSEMIYEIGEEIYVNFQHNSDEEHVVDKYRVIACTESTVTIELITTNKLDEVLETMGERLEDIDENHQKTTPISTKRHKERRLEKGDKEWRGRSIKDTKFKRKTSRRTYKEIGDDASRPFKKALDCKTFHRFIHRKYRR